MCKILAFQTLEGMSTVSIIVSDSLSYVSIHFLTSLF